MADANAMPPPSRRAAATAATPSTDRLFLAGWWLTVQTLPFYTFDSGLPQPSDFLLLAIATLPGLLALPRLAKTERRAVTALIMFITIISAVNIIWSSLLGATDFLVATSFYIFNATVFLGILAHGTRLGPRFATTTGRALAVSLAIQLALALAFPDRNISGRLSLFFNNPNQLAYYALGSATVIAMAGTLDQKLRNHAIVALLAAAWLAYRTYSRAASLGIAGLLLLWLVRRPMLALAILLPLLLIAGGADLATREDPLWESRIERTMQSDPSDYIEDRGLERIFDHPEYLLLGAGEGQHIRFHPLGLELHSSLASMAFCYGALGFIAFVVLLWRSLSRAPARVALLFVPSLVYSLFHNGLRFRIFWIALATVVISAQRSASPTSRPVRRERPRPLVNPAGAGADPARQPGVSAPGSKPRRS